MSLSTVTTMGYEIGTLGLVTTLGYGQGAAPPPPPPVITTSVYGPALTPAQRRRWFSDCDPEERRCRKEAYERAKRIELGIIKELVVPKEIRAEVKEVVREAVREQIVASLPQFSLDPVSIVSKIAYEVAQELVLELREHKTIEANRRILRELAALEEEEEDEAMEVATLFMLQ